MVLVFMFSASWRLTIVTFVMIPMVLIICKVRCDAVAAVAAGGGWGGGGGGVGGICGCSGNVWLT
jgi:hypothetical protein